MNIEKEKLKKLIDMYFEAYKAYCETEEESAPSGEYEAYNTQYLRVCDEEQTLEKVLNTLGITIEYNVSSEENKMELKNVNLSFYFEDKLMYRIFINEELTEEFFIK